MSNEQTSEIARLRRQIEEQLVSMQRGLAGLSSGSARHTFITARMERLGADQIRLASQVGEEAAGQLFYQLYNAAMGTQEPEGCDE